MPALKTTQQPILDVADWFERQIIKKHFNALAQDGQKVYLFFNEVQNLQAWVPPKLKV